MGGCGLRGTLVPLQGSRMGRHDVMLPCFCPPVAEHHAGREAVAVSSLLLCFCVGVVCPCVVVCFLCLSLCPCCLWFLRGVVWPFWVAASGVLCCPRFCLAACALLSLRFFRVRLVL